MKKVVVEEDCQAKKISGVLEHVMCKSQYKRFVSARANACFCVCHRICESVYVCVCVFRAVCVFFV